MKKLFYVFLILAMVLSSFTYAFAEPANADAARAEAIKLLGNKQFTKLEQKINELAETLNEDKISIIVELEEKPVLEEKNALSMGATNYLQTAEATNKIAKLEASQASVKNAIKAIDKNVEFGYNFNLVVNGFEAKVTALNLKAISKLPGIKNIHENIKYTTPEPQMVSSVGMVFPGLQGEQEFKGEGTAVAVIDTGVAVDNVLMRLNDPSLGKIGKTYVGQRLDKLQATKIADAEGEDKPTAETLYGSVKVPFQFDYTDGLPDASTDQTEGGSEHGVHVSGTVAANKNGLSAADAAKLNGTAINGVAPEAQILGMKVFDEAGSAYDEWIFAAVEDAITLGADAINLSLGSSCGFTLTDADEPSEMAMVFERARKAGVVVAVAASNDNRTGESGQNLYRSEDPLAAYPDSATVGDPSTKIFATTVASFENDNVFSSYFKHNGKTIKSSDVTYPEPGFEGSFDEAANGKTFVDCGKGTVDDFTDEVKAAVKGKIALIQRGDITFSEKSYNAAQAGAVACVIYNNAPGNLGITMVGGTAADGTPITNKDVVPTVGIVQADGEAIKTALDKPVDANGYVDSLPSEEKGKMSSFSSWGATPDLKLKPEILAPGGQIYSTVSGNNFVTMSGTSMATPHVAGGAAVVRNYLNSINYSDNLAKVTQVAEALMMSTAVPQVNTENDVFFSPRQQGAGLMNLTAATQGVTYILNEDTQKAKVELGDKLAAGTPKTFTFTVYNDEPIAKTFDLSGNVLIEGSYDNDDGDTFISNKMKELSASKVTFDTEKITVPANGTKTVTATLTLDAAEMNAQSTKFVNGFFVEGFVTLTADDLTNTYPNLGVPYMGFYGNWDKAPVFDAICYIDDIMETGNWPFFLNTSVYGVDGESTYDFANFLFGQPLELNMSYMGEDYSGEMSGSQYIAISPKDFAPTDFFGMPFILSQTKDRAYFSVDMLRNAKALKFKVLDAEGKVVSEYIMQQDTGEKVTDASYCRKSFYYSGLDTIVPGLASFIDLSEPGQSVFLGWDTLYWDGTDSDGKFLDDGQYFIEVSGQVDYDGARTDVIKLPVKVDNTVPTAKKFTETDDNGNVIGIKVTASDNYYVDFVEGVYNFKYMADDYDDDGNEIKVEETLDIVLPVLPMYFAKDGAVTFSPEDLTEAVELALEEYDGYFDEDTETQAKLESELKAATLSDLTYNAVDSAANRGEAATALTVTAKANDKVYDGTTDATVEYELVPNTLGLVEGTDYTVKAEFAQADVGENIPVTFTFQLLETEKTKGLVLDNQASKLTANITPKELTVDPLKVADKVYDGTTDAKITELVLNGAIAPLELGKDYEAVATFTSPDAGKDVPVEVAITLNNPNYAVKSPVMTKATINKADRECPLKYTVDVKDGVYTITIEPVEGAEYNFGNGWTKSNTFVTEKSGKLTISIRIPEDKNYNEAKSEVTIKLTPEGAVETGDDTQIVLWVVLMAVAAAVAVGAGVYVKKSKKATK